MLGLGVTATDTEMGKTVVSGALASALWQRGYHTGVYKPAASGCVRSGVGKLFSTDAEFLLRCAGMQMEVHDEVVPYVLEAALTPAEAGKLAHMTLKPKKMLTGAKKMLAEHQVSIVEGVGGIATPLTEKYLVKDFFKDLSLPVVIVVQAVLGNVNHAVLTAEYAQKYGLKVLGVIVNNWDEANAGHLERSNLYYYEQLTGLPILGKLPVIPDKLLKNFDSNGIAKITEECVEIDKILELAGGQ